MSLAIRRCFEFMVEIDGIHVNGIDIIHWNDEGKIQSFKVLGTPDEGDEHIARKKWRRCWRR